MPKMRLEDLMFVMFVCDASVSSDFGEYMLWVATFDTSPYRCGDAQSPIMWCPPLVCAGLLTHLTIVISSS